jgi:hypothetical protein
LILHECCNHKHMRMINDWTIYLARWGRCISLSQRSSHKRQKEQSNHHVLGSNLILI